MALCGCLSDGVAGGFGSVILRRITFSASAEVVMAEVVVAAPGSQHVTNADDHEMGPA